MRFVSLCGVALLVVITGCSDDDEASKDQVNAVYDQVDKGLFFLENGLRLSPAAPEAASTAFSKAGEEFSDAFVASGRINQGQIGGTLQDFTGELREASTFFNHATDRLAEGRLGVATALSKRGQNQMTDAGDDLPDANRAFDWSGDNSPLRLPST